MKKICGVKGYFNCRKEEIEKLKAHATLKGITATEALRRAMFYTTYLWEEKNKGSRIFIDRGGDTLREILWKE
jgi:hypothetical protein